MKTTSKSQVQTISEWLDIATKGLAPSAKQRITQEIQSHYADALQAHLDETQNLSEASLAALNELGDPSLAAKIYRKKYLTLKEEREISSLVTQAGKPLTKSTLIPNGILAILLFYGFTHPAVMDLSVLIASGAFLAYGVVPILSRKLFTTFPAKRAVNGMLLLEPLRIIGYLMYVLYLLSVVFPRVWIISIIGMGAVWSFSHYLRTRSRFLKTEA